MAQVPYSPVPDVALTDTATPRVGVQTPVAAFGGASAEATTHLGQAMSQAGNELFTRAVAMQHMSNDADAKNASINVAAQLGQLRDDYMQKSGADAVAGLPIYQKSVQDVRQQALDNAGNPQVKMLLDADVTSRINRDLDLGGLHAATEHKNYIVGTAEASINLAKIEAANNWNNPAAYDKSIQNIRDQVDFLKHVKGMSDVEADAKATIDVGEANYKKLEAQAITDPFGARSTYQKDPTAVGPYREQTEAMLEREEAGVGSRILANSISKGSYIQRLASGESGNNVFAKSQTSSAEGLYQFTKGTWSDVRAAHPELNLPATVGAANSTQQTAAVQAFTKDNQTKLAAAGIETNGQNTYLAHFLGAGGAVQFFNGMKANPGEPGTALVSPQVANANREIFFNPDGTPRSAASVYMRLTAKYAGPGELTKDSPATWLAAAEKVGSQLANEVNPNNPALADATQSRLRTQYSLVHDGAIQAQLHDLNNLQLTINGNGDYDKRLVSLDQITTNPVMSDIYNHLDDKYKLQIQNQIEKNAKADVPFTTERRDRFNSVMGILTDPNQRARALTIDPSQLDLPHAQQLDVIKAKNRIIANLQVNDRLNYALKDPIVQNLTKGMGLVAGSPEENQYRGEFSERLQEYENLYKKVPDIGAIRDIAKDLTTSHSMTLSPLARGYYGYEHSSAGLQSFAAQITPAYQKKYGQAPTPDALRKMYLGYLDNPSLLDEVK